MSEPKSDVGKSTLNARPVPSIVLIAVDDRTAEIARECVQALLIRVPDLREADWRIPIARPLVVAVGKPLSLEAAQTLSDLAGAVGASIVQLDTCRSPGEARERLVTAWRVAEKKAAGVT